MCYCYLPDYIIIELLTVLSTHLNLFHRRDEGYLAEKYGLDIDIYLFDLIKQSFFFPSMRSIKHIKFRSCLAL